MPQKHSERSNDRFIPNRAFINFEDAYWKISDRLGEFDEKNFSCASLLDKKLQSQKRLAAIWNLNQRIFNNSSHKWGEAREPAVKIWPCRPRRKNCMKCEHVLDLPEFNYGFNMNTIDWGPNDLVASSISNEVLVGGGFFSKQRTTEKVAEYEGDRCTALQWDLRGVLLALGSEEGVVQVLDMTRNKCLSEEMCCHGQMCTISSMEWHPFSNALVWGCENGRITVRTFKDKQKLAIENAHVGHVCALKFSTQAQYLCSSGEDGYVRLWKGTTYDPYMEIEMSHPVRAIAWHPWRSGLLAIGEGSPGPGSFSIWNINIGELLHLKRPLEDVSIEALDFSKLTGELICAQHKKRAEKETSEVVVLGGPDFVVDSTRELSGKVMSLLWSADGTTLGTGSSDETLRIWNFQSTQKQKQKRVHCNSDEDLAFMALKKFKCTVR